MAGIVWRKFFEPLSRKLRLRTLPLIEDFGAGATRDVAGAKASPDPRRQLDGRAVVEAAAES